MSQCYVIRFIPHFQTHLPSYHVTLADLIDSPSESEISDVEAPSYSSISSATDDEMFTPENLDEYDGDDVVQESDHLDSSSSLVINFCGCIKHFICC